ncbi:MAG: hypothetical protein QM831_17045 [Kofleriaceae bacterium]
MKRRLSPQQKKRYAKLHDHPVSKKTLRKLVAAQKKAAERSMRAAVRTHIMDDDLKPKHRKQVHSAGTPLGEIIERKKSRRANQTPRKSPAARKRRAVKRSGRRRGSRS